MPPAKVTEPYTDAAYGRTRLFDRIGARPITWIAGPPGAGKTTLVASYLKKKKLTAVWYRIDPGDDDAASLFYYLREAVDPALPLWTAGALPSFARRFFETLYRCVPARAVIVFDDFQDAPAESSWMTAWQLGLAAVPPDRRVIVASRNEPPIALARQRAAGELDVIGWEDLRLSFAEAAGIAKLRAKDVPTAVLRHVHEVSGGLAVGLVLMLANARHAEVRAGEVFDYFASELFAPLDDDTRRFLLRSALLPTLSEHAIKTLAGAAAPAILRRLRRHELLADRLAGDAPIYRYHPLFREFLRAQPLPPEELAAARRDAAALLVAEGQPDLAFTLLRDAGDVDSMAALVAREAPALLATGRRQTLAGWLRALPPSTIERDGWLSLWQGICTIGVAGSPTVAALTRAHALLAHPIAQRRAWSAAVNAIMLEADDFARLDAWLDRRPEPSQLPPDVDLELANAELLVLQYRRAGAPTTQRAAERALVLAGSAPDLPRAMTVALLVMYYVFFDGDVGRASTVLEMVRDVDTARDPMVHIASRLAEAIHAWAAGDEARSLAATIDGVDAAEAAGIDGWNNRLLGIGVAAALGRNDLSTARRMLDDMVHETSARFDVGNFHYYAGWEAHVRGDHVRAAEHARRAIEIADAVDFPFARALGRIALAVACPDEAATALREARSLATEMASRFTLFACGLVEADSTDDDRVLRDALALGSQLGCYNAFWVTNRALARLCQRALVGGIEVAYVQELVRRRRVTPEVLPVHLEAWPWKIRVNVLGRFELQGAPAADSVPLRLLSAAIAFGGRSVRKDRLVDAIWPDLDGDAAVRAFDVALHRLRNLLGDREAIAVADGCLHVAPELVWTDASAVEALLARDDAEGALALYRGKLLDGEDAAWATAPRQRLHRRVLDAVLAAKLAPDATIDLCQRALAIDDTSDALYQRLIACLLQENRRADVMHVYDRCRNALALAGVRPSRAVEQLVSRL